MNYKVEPSLYTKDYYLNECSNYKAFNKGKMTLTTPQKYVYKKIPYASQKDMRFLDAGCGRGEMLVFMQKKGYKVYGIDYASEAIDLASTVLSENNVNGDLKVGDVRHTDYPDDFFDVIVSDDVLEHLDDENASIDFLNEMYRVLKPGGSFWLHTSPNKNRVDVFERHYQVYVDFILKTSINLFKKEKIPIPKTDQGKLDVRSDYAKKMHVNEQDPNSLRIILSKSAFRDFTLRTESAPLIFDKQEIMKLPYYILAHLFPFNKLTFVRNYLGSDLFFEARKNLKQDMLFVALNNFGTQAFSGGDTIFLSFLKYWKDQYNLTALCCYESDQSIKSQGLLHVHSIPLTMQSAEKSMSEIFSVKNLLNHIFSRTWSGFLYILKNRAFFKTFHSIYSVSDFYPDLFPALLIKILNPKVRWIAGYFLIVPAPWSPEFPYKDKTRLRGILYWLMQRPTYLIVKYFADIILVTSIPDVGKFSTNLKADSRIIVVRGGVEIKAADDYLNSPEYIPMHARKYDACFMGRFHPQKGVLELIDIWKEVTDTKLDYKLIMIGDGELLEPVRKKIHDLNLEHNVDLAGYQSGDSKFDIFKQSKIVVHPAVFDSGGMAAAEAMAWGLPGVSFDLEALRTYYPKGMLKIPCYDKTKFAQAIIKLLTDEVLYTRICDEALDLVKSEWVWSKRAQDILKEIDG